MSTDAWAVIGIAVPIILALVGAATHLTVSRMNRQSMKFEDLRKTVHDSLGALRERVSRIEGRIEEVNGLYRANVPEMWDCIRTLERWQSGMCVRCDRCQREAEKHGKDGG